MAECDSKNGDIYHHIHSRREFENISKMVKKEGSFEPNIVVAEANYTPWNYEGSVEFRDAKKRF